jgi:hypothetical protein
VTNPTKPYVALDRRSPQPNPADLAGTWFVMYRSNRLVFRNKLSGHLCDNMDGESFCGLKGDGPHWEWEKHPKEQNVFSLKNLKTKRYLVAERTGVQVQFDSNKKMYFKFMELKGTNCN